LRKHLVALAVLLLALALPGLSTLRSPAHPAEDAAILMRYVEHVAQGHGMVWNLGEPPVDGATDFLFTVLAAALVRGGVPLEAAVRGLAAAAHALTVLLLYGAIRRLHGAPLPLALACALFLAWGPGFRYAELYFATPFFALLGTAAWALAYRLRERPESRRLALLFALTCLATGLARPEGVFLSLFLLAAVVFWVGPRRALGPAAVFAAVFAGLGGLFFLWRWSYFGHPLPTPFYKKGGGTLHWKSLRASLDGLIQLCLPWLLAAPIALRSRDALRRLLFSLIPVGGFTLLWVLLSNEMNVLYRFQYVLLPIVLLSFPDWASGLAADLGLPPLAALSPGARRAAIASGATLAVAVLAAQAVLYRPQSQARDGRYDAARLLARYSSRGYTLVTSEAGLLPLYSRWHSVDSWGLNDLEIARHGLSQGRLEREHPQIIVFHAFRSPLAPGAVDANPDWARMVAELTSYGERHGYVVAAVYGHDPYETHTYLVRSGSPDAAAIVAGLRALDYHSRDGLPCVNFALWTYARR